MGNSVPRARIVIEGIVQGVGFRPFVYQSARSLGLTGWVMNDSRGVLIEAEGQAEALAAFLTVLREDLPPLAAVSHLETAAVPVTGETEFVIRQSCSQRERRAQISPDTFVCPDCLRELLDPSDRRYRYPFINCTNCGPRYTIVTGIPYDRAQTTMAAFPMCPACRREYEDPASRRFHAQPNACPECGPRLFLLDAAGNPLESADPLQEAIAWLQKGEILAVKGLGGYHLAVDATNGGAVEELRRRKARDEKPFALMAADLARIDTFAEVREGERRLLAATERPIVLVRQRSGHAIAPSVAPDNRYFGVMLPYTPLHYLLLAHSFAALVMTSANRSDEPIAFRDADARGRLSGIADLYLGHNREIFIRTDDSIARVMGGRPLLLRRSRGFVPRGLRLPRAQPVVLAVGGELKNTVCLTRDDHAYLSQHVGDLQNPEVFQAFLGTIEHLQDLLELNPQIVAHDLHPDYASSRYAEERSGVRRVAVQHHHAHLASCLAENQVATEAIGVIFDGTGYGADGRIWGGEFLVGDLAGYRRVGHFDYLPMPGGDAAAREPYRMALSALYRAYGKDLPQLPLLASIPRRELRLLLQMIEKGINSPLTSSCGRLFDAVAALTGLRTRVSYEGQAALELEMAIEGDGESEAYPLVLATETTGIVFKTTPLIRAVVDDIRRQVPTGVISARFHATLARAVAAVCCRIRKDSGLNEVALSGGVFQNRFLTEKALFLLTKEGFNVYTHSLVPPNDGGLALGQAAVAGRQAG